MGQTAAFWQLAIRSPSHIVLGLASPLAIEESGCSLSSVSSSMKKLGIDHLDVEQRLALIEEIWESIDAEDSAAVQISDAQRAELQARLADHEANPDDVLTLEEVEASLPLSRKA